jgi:hypothetical protein
MSIGYMGNTSICREFVKNKTAGFGFTDDCKLLLCSSCTTVLLHEPDTMLVVDSATNKKLQCIHCYAKTVGITTTTTTAAHLKSPPTSTPATPSAPRARNTSDVSETECAADAANAVASFSAVMNQQQQQQQQQFQASAAMLTCDGMYQNPSSPS